MKIFLDFRITVTTHSWSGKVEDKVYKYKYICKLNLIKKIITFGTQLAVGVVRMITKRNNLPDMKYPPSLFYKRYSRAFFFWFCLILATINVLIIKSPKHSLGDLLFLLRFLLLLFLFLFLFLFFSFLSVHHELVHGRSQELQDRISWNLVEL